jgi:hypothetical protein
MGWNETQLKLSISSKNCFIQIRQEMPQQLLCKLSSHFKCIAKTSKEAQAGSVVYKGNNPFSYVVILSRHFTFRFQLHSCLCMLNWFFDCACSQECTCTPAMIVPVFQL